MNVGKFKVDSQTKLTRAIQTFYPELSYNAINKILRQKDVKVNGKRVSVEMVLDVGDEVVFYFKEESQPIEVVFEDENIIVVNKPKNIETVVEGEGVSLCTKLEKLFSLKLYAVHRLDRNTTGLVIFAKTQKAKESLDCALKNRTLEKYYLAHVFGTFEKQSDKLIAYLKKDSKNALVKISDEQFPGFDLIQTNYKVVEEFDNSSVIEVELVTGKTHQIRAHFSHIGHYLIGDEKYGDVKLNKLFGKKTQCLAAYKIIFHFEKGDALEYLNNKTIELPKENIKFSN